MIPLKWQNSREGAVAAACNLAHTRLQVWPLALQQQPNINQVGRMEVEITGGYDQDTLYVYYICVHIGNGQRINACVCMRERRRPEKCVREISLLEIAWGIGAETDLYLDSGVSHNSAHLRRMRVCKCTHLQSSVQDRWDLSEVDRLCQGHFPCAVTALQSCITLTFRETRQRA